MSSDKPQLFVRNETNKTVTFNEDGIRWELPPLPNPNYVMALPWEVAVASGFRRLWDADKVTVALDHGFDFVLEQLPSDGGLSYRPYVHLQSVPQATTDIQHNLSRSGPVRVEVTSIDKSIEWLFPQVDYIDLNTCRVSFDDPTTFLATVF